MGPFTLIDIILSAVGRGPSCVAKHKVDDQWTDISSQQLRESVISLARTLQDWGIRKGDRVAILSENRPEWAIADFAALSIGAVDVPIYATLTAEQAAAIMKDSGARILFLSSKDQLDKFVTIRDQTFIEKVVVFDEVDLQGKTSPVPIISWRSIFSGTKVD